MTTQIPQKSYRRGNVFAPPRIKAMETVGLAPLPRFVAKERLGEGGTSVVYRAKDRNLGWDVALKRFKNEHTGRDYLAELESISRIQHHHVVTCLDAGRDQQGPFIAMELIKGLNLEERLRTSSLNGNQFFEMAVQALEALTATHQGGLLHLDLKPSNIMLTELDSGRHHLTFIDYGKAQLQEAPNVTPPIGGGLNGSLHYTSPEYLSEQPVNVHSDLYSLGCVFYEALSGQRPFEGNNAIQIMAAHLCHQVTDLAELIPLAPDWLPQCVMSMIQYQPQDRPDSAETILRTFLDQGHSARLPVAL